MPEKSGVSKFKGTAGHPVFRRGVPDRRSLPLAKPYAIQTYEEEEREQLNYYVTAGGRGKDTRNCGSETSAAAVSVGGGHISSSHVLR